MMKKIILIENKSQAKEYLKNRSKFEEFLPITFNFESEELLLKEDIKFKTEEDYETETIYRRIYDLSLKNTKEICEKIKINYRGIDLMQLFYMDLYRFLYASGRCLRVLEKIKKKEKVKEIIILKNTLNLSPREEVYSKIAQEVFKGKTKKIIYREKSEKAKLTIQIGRFVQKILSKMKLSLLNKKYNKIFFDDSKVRMGSLLKELLENKNNKLFRCQDHLQKSFFVDKQYIPFYEFSQKKNKLQSKLLEDVSKFKKRYKSFKFLNELDIEVNLKPIIREWINYYLQFKFLEISGTINHIIKLMKKDKIDCIIVFSDSESFDKVFVQVGKLLDIPSIVVLHGLLGKEFSPGFIPLSADYIFAYGKGSKERLYTLGIPNEKIITTGSQQFDKYLDKKIPVKKEKKIVFIASYGTKKEAKYTLRIIFNALKKFPEYKLVVKGREGWEMNNLPKIIAEQENFKKVEFVIKINPIKLLFDADIVIINATTMVLDVLLLDKPVISIRVGEMENLYKNSKSIKTVYNQKQLEQAIKECQNQTEKDTIERKKYLKEELFKLDGKASERMVNFINKLIEERKSEKNKNNSPFGY